MSERLAALAGLPVAAAPIARREFPLAPFVMVPPGQASVGMPSDGFRELDTVDPIARMMMRSGVGRTVDDIARLYGLATGALGFTGATAGQGMLMKRPAQ